MEYYWELRRKNAQNIKALTCPLYLYTTFPIRKEQLTFQVHAL